MVTLMAVIGVYTFPQSLWSRASEDVTPVPPTILSGYPLLFPDKFVAASMTRNRDYWENTFKTSENPEHHKWALRVAGGMGWAWDYKDPAHPLRYPQDFQTR